MEYEPITFEESMLLPKQQFIDRCKAWLAKFNAGVPLKLEDPLKCPLAIWVIYNHRACGKSLVPGIVDCEICGSPICPHCSNHGASQISRVTGYMGDVAGFNAGKREELKDRTRYNTLG